MSNQTERILEKSAASTVSTVANKPIELQYTVYGTECKETADEQWTDLERSRSCRRSAQCRFSVQPPEPDLQLPRSVLLDPDWLLTTYSSGLKTHSKYTLWHWLHGLILYHKYDLWIQSSFPMSPLWRKLIFVKKKKKKDNIRAMSPFSLSFFSFSFLVFPARREARSMRGVRGVEVTDEGVWSTALEIFDTGAKIPAGQKKRQTHQNVKASGQRQTC